MLDLILAGASCVSGTITELAGVGGSSLTIKDRLDPRVKQVGMAGDANIQYGLIVSPDLPQMGMSIPHTQLNRQTPFKGKIPKNSVLTPSILQDSGGPITEYMGILMSYGQPGRRSKQSIDGRPCSQRVDVTSGNAGWGDGQALTNLKADKLYGLLGFSIHNSTDFVALKFVSNMFDGLEPGAVCEATDTLANSEILFPEDDIPVFKGSDGLTVYAFGDGNSVCCHPLLVEMD